MQVCAGCHVRGRGAWDAGMQGWRAVSNACGCGAGRGPIETSSKGGCGEVPKKSNKKWALEEDGMQRGVPSQNGTHPRLCSHPQNTIRPASLHWPLAQPSPATDTTDLATTTSTTQQAATLVVQNNPAVLRAPTSMRPNDPCNDPRRPHPSRPRCVRGVQPLPASAAAGETCR